MYEFRTNLLKNIKEKYKLNNIAKLAGLTSGYLSLILNGKITCPKRTAIAISKTLNENSELENYFIEIG